MINFFKNNTISINDSWKFEKGLTLNIILGFFEGLFAIIWAVQTPSMEKNVWMFGLSWARLAAIGVALIPLTTFFILAVKSAGNRGWSTRTAEKAAEWLARDNHTGNTILSLTLFALTGIYLFILFHSPGAIILGPLPFIFQRIQSLFAWGILVFFQIVILLVWAFPDHAPATFYRAQVLKISLLWLAFAAILSHWAILIFKLDLLASIPGWFWQFHEKTFGVEDLLILPMVFTFLAVGYYVMAKPGRTWFKLLLLIILGYGFQIGFGFIDGGGIEAVRLKYAESTHAVYALHASDQPGLYRTITEYEPLFGENGYVQTKPPGMMVFYILTGKAANLFFPHDTYQKRFTGLTTFAAYIFPLISFLTLIPLFFLADGLLGKQKAWLACILYLTVPMIMLAPLFLDQVLFPLLFITNAWLFVYTLKKSSLPLSILSGLMVYLSIYFSFTMVTLIPLAFAMGGVYLLRKKGSDYLTVAKLILGLLAGFALTYLCFFILLNYDPLIRFNSSMAIHFRDDFFNRFGISPQGGYNPSLLQRVNVLNVNMASFAVWVGLPIFFLFICNGVRLVYKLRKNLFDVDKGYLLAMLATLIALFISGEAAGEVARQWAFSITLLVIFASSEIGSLFKYQKKWVLLILLTQLSTIYLTFKFQDFFT